MARHQRAERVVTMRYSVDVFRGAHGCDCSLGGESSRHENAIITTDGNDPAEINGRPVWLLVRRGDYLHVRPISAGEKWCMFGGNFAWSCDSWFRRDVSQYPIAIHDRIE